jgi:AcrR family transcriptional regulator
VTHEERQDGRKQRGERTRLAIMDATLTALAAHGKTGFSARVIAEHAGVSKATVFHHFATMEDIVVAIFERMIEAAGAPSVVTPGMTLEEFIEARLSQMLEFMAGMTDKTSAYFHLVEILRSNERTAHELETMVGEFQRDIAKCIAELCGDTIDPVRIRRGVDMLAAVMEGMGVMLSYYNTAEDYREAIPDFAKMMARYLKGE